MVNILTFEQALDSAGQGKKNLLLGNGFSIACEPRVFSYSSLYEQAQSSAFRTTPELQRVFEALGTNDFEVAIRALENSAKLIPIYAPNVASVDQVILRHSHTIKDALIRTIAENHPATPNEVPEQKFYACRKFLSYFIGAANAGRVYTLNYDLLLYWTVMHEDVPDMRVEVVAPSNAEMDGIYKKVRKRAKWVKTQQIFFEQFHPKTPPRQYISGENHRYLGRQLRLKVRQDIANDVKVSGGYIVVSSHYPNNQNLTRELTEGWFKARARQKFRERLALCIEKFPSPKEFIPQGIIIRHLLNRWGSMTGEKRLVLNTRLVHAPIICIDYVIIHELCHIRYPNHGVKFWKLLSSVLPNWEMHKRRLERCVL